MTRPTDAKTLAERCLLATGAIIVVGAGFQLAGDLLSVFSGLLEPSSVNGLTILRAWYWHDQNPALWEPLIAATACSLLAVMIALAPLVMKRSRSLHGETRWANESEIRRSGFIGDDGIVVGKVGRRFLTFNGTTQGKNVMCAAPPGSGKTAGLMIPNCLAWPGSIVALDLKGECYDRTAGYRKSKGQKVARINFMAKDYRTHQYDPFAYVSEDKNFRVGDVERISLYLIPEREKTDPIWTSGARQIFQAIALYLLDTNRPCTLGAIFDMLNTPRGLQAATAKIVADVEAGEVILDAAIVRDLAAIALRPEKTFGGQKDELNTALAPLRNPLVRLATSANTIDLRKLRSEQVSVYLTIERPDLTALKSLINLFFQQLVDLNSTVEYGKDPSHRHEVLLAMDEFAQLGKLASIFQGITFFRSYGLRLLAIMQSPSQMRETYGVEASKTFEQSFDCSVFFTPAARDVETPELLSKLLGKQTVKASTRSRKTNVFDSAGDSQSDSDFGRALMLPQEISSLPTSKQIVLISGFYPIQCNKIRAWKEAVFKGRNGKAPSTPMLAMPDEQFEDDELEEGAERTPDMIAEAVTSDKAAQHASSPFHVDEGKSSRPLSIEDMDNLANMTLDDFDLDFSSIVVPKGELSAEDIESLRNELFDHIASA